MVQLANSRLDIPRFQDQCSGIVRQYDILELVAGFRHSLVPTYFMGELGNHNCKAQSFYRYGAPITDQRNPRRRDLDPERHDM